MVPVKMSVTSPPSRAVIALPSLKSMLPSCTGGFLLVAAAIVDRAVVGDHGVSGRLGLREVAGATTTMFGSARMMAMSSVDWCDTPSAP